MNTETENLTAHQSLDIITSMIRQAKGNAKKNAFFFLLWGWTILIANLGVYVLINYSSVKNPFMMFMITIPAAIISAIYGMRQGRQARVSTILDQINMWTWIGFGVNCLIFWYFGRLLNWNINPVITTLCAVPTFVTGVMLRFKPLLFGGVVFWIFGVIMFLVSTETQFLLSAVAVGTGYLIPGYMLRRSDA